MRVKKTSRYEVTLEEEELKAALVHWMSRGPRSTAQTGNIAVKVNNSECNFNLSAGSSLTIRFDWEEDDESR